MNQALFVLSVFVVANVAFLAVWKNVIQNTRRQPDRVFHTEGHDRLRIRWTSHERIITAYFEADLPVMGGMMPPRAGMMIFTDRGGIPRTGNFSDLEKLASQTGYELIQESKHGFYVIGSGVSGASLADDLRDYGAFIVPNLAKAVATANQNQAEANALLEHA